MEDNKILIIDDEGREREFTILFTFNSDDEDPEMGDNYAVKMVISLQLRMKQNLR